MFTHAAQKHEAPLKVCSHAILILTTATGIATCAADARADSGFPAADVRFFEEKVRPILIEHCHKCHGDQRAAKGGLRLTSRANLIAGGDTGPAFSTQEPGESLLLEAINYQGYEMPPSGKLPQQEIDLLTRWVLRGAAWPTEVGREDNGSAESGVPQVDDEARQFWSFQPVRATQPPEVQSPHWVRNPIDAFVLRRLEEAGLSPAPPASKQQLIRRAYYDLTGLPPEPGESDAFLRDDSADAFEKLVDRLLDSPHYGERWGRHWLDLVRYAETNSYERDGAKPFVWRYRDYVIRSFNEDKPYTRFILEQLAGDELDPTGPESLVATGYYRLGIWQDEPVDPLQELFEDLDDIVRTTAEVYLGLTIGCARCHDHKLDPIPQRDYYRFLAFFRNIRRLGVRSHESVLAASVRPIGSSKQQERYQRAIDAHRRAERDNKRAIAEIDDRVKKTLVGVEVDDWKTEGARIEIVKQRIGTVVTQAEFEAYVELAAQRDELRKFKPPGLDQALCITEHGRDAPTTHVLVRGNAHVAGDAVEPGVLSVLPQGAPEIVVPEAPIASTGRRRALAQWIADPANPLTARVMVNRIWHYHFGRGLVRTASDFGYQGAPPTHPELLDWLAHEFVAGGWRMKRLHKLIMLSSTYQMSAQADDQALARDPTNDLFWRFDMRRLSAEEIRDSILAVNTTLNRKAMYGPSIFTKMPREILAGQSRPGEGWGKSPPDQQARRSVYIHVKRSLTVPLIASFDGPNTDASCPIRFATTQPTQALGMLNSDFIQEQAGFFADYLQEEAARDPEGQVKLGLRRVLQRNPRPGELSSGVRLLNSLTRQHGMSARHALERLCVTMLNLNEFIYLD